MPLDIENVLQKLTDAEKVSLLAGIDFWHTKALPDHGIPSLRVSDGPNGLRGTRFFNGVPSACLPCGTALGSTFDKDLLYEAGQLMAEEAKAKGAHIILGPTVNMQRSPLGGRGFESYSEDPVLAGLSAAALITGIQSRDIIATLKHFVCNDQEHERNKVNCIVTERALRELYLLPFQLAIRDSKPKCIMTAYNKVNGIHMSENQKLINDVLRNEWAWKGLVMSDWSGTYSTSQALNAGLDLEMPGPSRWRKDLALQANSTHKLEPTVLDDRARAVLELVNECEKSGIPENAPELTRDIPETSALLRRLAAESIVLLKNENGCLPLEKSKKTLVIGPNAAVATFCGGGSASLWPYYTVTPLNAIRDKVNSTDNVVYTIGAYSHKELPNLALSLRTTRNIAGSKTGFTFTTYNEPPESTDRKALDRLELNLANMMFMDYKHPDLNSLWYADLEGYLEADRTGDFEFGMCVYGSAQMFIDSKLLVDITKNQRQGSAFFGCGTAEERGSTFLEKGKTYHVQVRFASAPTSKLRPQGVVTFSGGAIRFGGAWKIRPEEEIIKAADLAKQFDQVVICIGLNKDWESEGFDRPDMKLPPYLDALVEAVGTANPRSIVVVQSGTPVEMPWVSKISGLLQAWYGGNETGNGIADVLFGDVNPSAKLPLSFPHRIEHTPTFLNHRSEAGRVLYGEDVYMGYRYYDTVQLPVNFSFGFGLSYTTFIISDLAVNTTVDLSVKVQVLNTGSRDGAEVVQLYVSQATPLIKRPAKELKDFKKVALAPGTSVTVDFNVPLKYACSYFDERRNQWVCEKGDYTVYVSNSSQLIPDKFVEATFYVEKTFWWSGL